jgi:Tfp pilus assembly protein PilZ
MQNNTVKHEKQSITDRLFELIHQLSAEEKIALLQQIEAYIGGKNTEKRGHARTKCLLSLNYDNLLEKVIDYANDISPSGLFMQTTSNLAVGDVIYLRINFSEDSKPFQIPAEVIRATSKGVGLKFRFKSRVQQTIITSLINKLEKMEQKISAPK